MNLQLKNFTISEFNTDVNNSGSLDGKYKRWHTYRTQVSEFIMESISSKQNLGSIIVLGAGECNDIDLKFLLSNFDKVVLTDTDISGINNGIKRQRLNADEEKKIEVEQVEYTGLEFVGFFDMLSTMVSNGAAADEVISFIQNALKTVVPFNVLRSHKNRFDYVLSCPIYTQLVYTQAQVLMKVLTELTLYNEEEIQSIDETFKEHMPRVIENYNDILISVASKDAIITVLTDIVEVQGQKELLSKIEQALSQKPLETRALEQIVSSSGLEFGQIGRADLLGKIDAKTSLYSMWPFDEYKDYLVCGLSGMAQI